MRILLISLISLICLTSCGGGSSSSTSTITGTVATLYPGTFEYTSVDPTAPANYAAPALPAHYDATLLATSNQTAANVLTDKGATLGRVLFNDRRLSFNDSKSCASCHVQASGFADTAVFSSGFAGGLTTAHAMRLGNVAFYQAPAGGTATMFWDKRAATVEAQATQPIQNAVEMGFDSAHGGFAALITKMQALPYYPELFTWVFGDNAITEARVQNALAQYERSIISSSSKWDRAYAAVFAANGSVSTPQNFGRSLAGANIPAADRFTASEDNGRALFIQAPANGGKGCAGCHQPPTFSLNANSRSNGLDLGETRIFKSPSLKNVGLAGRFMHDGRFGTLTDVLTHYASGIKTSGTATDGRPALDNRLPVGGIPMTTQEQADIVAFLNTLTDSTLLTDTRFSNPFKK